MIRTQVTFPWAKFGRYFFFDLSSTSVVVKLNTIVLTLYRVDKKICVGEAIQHDSYLSTTSWRDFEYTAGTHKASTTTTEPDGVPHRQAF